MKLRFVYSTFQLSYRCAKLRENYHVANMVLESPPVCNQLRLLLNSKFSEIGVILVFVDFYFYEMRGLYGIFANNVIALFHPHPPPTPTPCPSHFLSRLS